MIDYWLVLLVGVGLAEVREWSLITGRGGGGYKAGGGGRASEVLPLKKRGGAGKCLAILKTGHKRFWSSFNTSA